MKKYKVRILMQSGTTQHWIEECFEADARLNTGSGYYYFLVDNKSKYYPMQNTIVEEID